MVTSSLVTIHVDTAPAHPLNTFRPIRAIGTGVDSDPEGKIPLLYSPSRTKLMLSTGLGSISYRLYTELSIQDWHWNPAGVYSDPQHHEGYWTSDARNLNPAITDSFGYRLPHRGSTRDQGDDDDYSRIDDGDPQTYWKSDPYLTHAYTGEPDSAHPQWALVDFGLPQPIDAVRIVWANPYATHFRIEYWIGDGDAILDQANGSWRSFDRGIVSNATGGDQLVRVSAPVNTRFIRVVMDQSSGTCDTHGPSDPRNCIGYAIDELYAGMLDEHGQLQDRIVHSRCGGNPVSKHCNPHQTIVFVSSIDPWHGDADRVRNGQDQPGLDVIARNPISRGLPVMYPVPLFYSTPENAAAEVRYLEARDYPVKYFEMGEEIDGQYALPEDYGALYIQWADAMHRADPRIKLGGPVFSGVNKDIAVWPDASGDSSWLHRFLEYLRRRGHLHDLAFMSFEHYPFRNCDAGAALQDDLLSESSLVRSIVATWRADGVPSDVPMFITESNFSADGTGATQRIAGALWAADWIATSLSSGIAGITFYQIEAEPLGRSRECGTWGAYNPYLVDDAYRVHANGAGYYADRMLTQEWVSPGDAEHAIYPATTTLGGEKPVLSAYPLRRPDGTWSVLLVNKDTVARNVVIRFDGSGRPRHFVGTLDVAVFGEAQYGWAGNGPDDLPSPDRGITHMTIAARDRFIVPARSLEVIRGAIR
jgi:hypothetical protein